MIWNQTGKGHGLSITPLPAGHMIGGTIWKIVKDGEEEIVYAVDFNHKREMWVEINVNGENVQIILKLKFAQKWCHCCVWCQSSERLLAGDDQQAISPHHRLIQRRIRAASQETARRATAQ